MYLMYVDESGDPGMGGSPTDYFALSGLVVHETQWRPLLDHLVAFRRRMNGAFGLKLREEIHSAHFINKPGTLKRIKRNDRLTILRHFADEIAKFPHISVINVVVRKTTKKPDFDPFEKAWQTLLQRFENTLQNNNFPLPLHNSEHGTIFADGLPQPKLRLVMRRMRRFNPIPSQFAGNRNIPATRIVEDPNYRDSTSSLIIQAADLVAFVLYQHLAPNSYMKKNGGSNYINRLDPVLCHVAARNNRLGIVYV
jgi:hypothetical protein